MVLTETSQRNKYISDLRFFLKVYMKVKGAEKHGALIEYEMGMQGAKGSKDSPVNCSNRWLSLTFDLNSLHARLHY